MEIKNIAGEVFKFMDKVNLVDKIMRHHFLVREDWNWYIKNRFKLGQKNREIVSKSFEPDGYVVIKEGFGMDNLIISVEAIKKV